VFVRLSVFPRDISKTHAAEITMSPGNRLLWGQNVKGQGHEVQRTLLAWVMVLARVSAGFFYSLYIDEVASVYRGLIPAGCLSRPPVFIHVHQSQTA